MHEVSFRPMDRRWLYHHSKFVDEMANRTNEVWGNSNCGLYALPSGTGAGPAVWVHGLLPDYHSFRGSYGGYAFPLWDRRRGPSAHNLNPILLNGLATTYGQPIGTEQTFDAITALLSATSYTSRFAWDLEEAFAHVPFPTSGAVFAEAAQIGAQIRALETFTRDPAPEYHSARLVGRASGVTLVVPPPARAFLDAGTGAGFVALQGRSVAHSRLAAQSVAVRRQRISRAAALARRTQWRGAQCGSAARHPRRGVAHRGIAVLVRRCRRCACAGGHLRADEARPRLTDTWSDAPIRARN